MTLTEAWGLWWQGNHLSEVTVVWGLKLLWWARIGKLLQCLAGLTIIAEIIGPERLRAFGNSLHGRFTIATARQYLADGIEWSKASYKFVFTLSNAEREAALNKTENTAIENFSLILNGVVAALVLIALRETFPDSILANIGAWLLFFVGIYLWSPVVTMLVILTALTIGAAIDSLLVEPIAWMLERPAIDRLVKVAAVLLLVIGFHFDFLAS